MKNDHKRRGQKVSVAGLANIGALLAQAELPKAVDAPAPKNSREAIVAKTAEKIHAALTGSNVNGSQLNLIAGYLTAAVRDGYNLGHGEALDQNSMVEKLLEQQYDARTKVTMPAVAAGIMEQSGLASMTLDLALLATVFERNTIDYQVSEENVIEFKLFPIDVVPG